MPEHKIVFHVLIVDDEKLIAKAHARMVESLIKKMSSAPKVGVHYETDADARAGAYLKMLDLFSAAAKDEAKARLLLITDWAMPLMGEGAKLIEESRKIAAAAHAHVDQITAVICSGSSTDAAADVERLGVEFLDKPVDKDKLADLIRRFLS